MLPIFCWLTTLWFASTRPNIDRALSLDIFLIVVHMPLSSQPLMFQVLMALNFLKIFFPEKTQGEISSKPLLLFCSYFLRLPLSSSYSLCEIIKMFVLTVIVCDVKMDDLGEGLLEHSGYCLLFLLLRI